MNLGRRHHGFTLIEILVAMTLLAIIGVLGFRGLDNVRHSTEKLGAIAARWQDIALACERIGRDVRQTLAVPGHLPDGRLAPSWQTRRQLENKPESAQLVFSRLGNTEGDLHRIGYRWEKTAAGHGQLSLLLWPSVDAAVPSRHYPLLNGVANLELAYLDRHGNWLDDWPSIAPRQLPRAVRLKLTLEEGGMIERIFDVPAAE